MSVYDVALADREGFFSARVRELCGFQNLSFFLVEPVWLREFLEKLQRGQIGVGVLIDMASDPYDRSDLYYRLAKEVKANGGHVIDDPDRSPLATHKSKFHQVLLQNHVPVPDTIFVERKDLPTFRVSDEIRARLGVPFVVKPGWGFGGRGVELNATSEADVVRSAERRPESDTFMLQKKLKPKTLEGRTAWFRIFHVCGEYITCWWQPGTGDYGMVSPLERHRYGLLGLEKIVFKIAQLSKMEFFSTEIAMLEDGQFVAVDYLNDECDTHPKSYWPSGVPDEVVRRIAWLFVQKAVSVVHKHPFENELVERDRDWQDSHKKRKLDNNAKAVEVAPGVVE